MPISTDREALERVRSKLLIYLDEAAEGARLSGRAVSLAAYYFRQRERLNRARTVLRTASDGQEHERIFREAELAYLRQRDAFETAPSSSSLMRAWTSLLMDATEKVERDKRDSELYATVGAQDEGWADSAYRVVEETWTDSD